MTAWARQQGHTESCKTSQDASYFYGVPLGQSLLSVARKIINVACKVFNGHVK